MAILSFILIVVDGIVLFSLPYKYYGWHHLRLLIAWQTPLFIALALGIVNLFRRIKSIIQSSSISIKQATFFGAFILASLILTILLFIDPQTVYMPAFWQIPFVILFVPACAFWYRRELNLKGLISAWLAVFYGIFMLVCLIPVFLFFTWFMAEEYFWSNIRAVGTACIDYAQQHQSHFPPNLAILIQNKMITPSELVYDLSGTVPLSNATDLNLLQHPDEVDVHSDVVYVGDGLNLSNLPDNGSNIVVLYSKDVFPNDYCIVAYAAGYDEGIPRSILPKILAQSDSLRR